jgi:hypothetical protein
MAATTPRNASYQGNKVGGNAIAIMGAIHGDVRFPDSETDPCVRDLRNTDPRDDKDRIEAGKDRLKRIVMHGSWITQIFNAGETLTAQRCSG